MFILTDFFQLYFCTICLFSSVRDMLQASPRKIVISTSWFIFTNFVQLYFNTICLFSSVLRYVCYKHLLVKVQSFTLQREKHDNKNGVSYFYCCFMSENMQTSLVFYKFYCFKFQGGEWCRFFCCYSPMVVLWLGPLKEP